MKKIAVAVLLFVVLASQMEEAYSSSYACHDSCTKECMGGDEAKMESCDGKCAVKCDPGFATTTQGGFV